MLAVELPAFVRIALQFLAVFYAFGKGAGFGGVFRIKPAGVHSFLGFFVHRFLFLRFLVACCRGIGQIGESIFELFGLFGLHAFGQFGDELADGFRLILVFRDVLDLPGDGVFLVEAQKDIRKVLDALCGFDFLLFHRRVAILSSPPFPELAHKLSFFR